MSKDKIVFIVGAGASKEAGLPTGNELKYEIAKLLNFNFEYGGQLTSGDPKIVNAFRQVVNNPENRQPTNIQTYIDESLHIKEALPLAISIDNFLDSHRNNEKMTLCGKLAIVRSILEAEKNSLLYFEKKRVDSTINFSDLTNKWFIPFFQLLTQNSLIDDLAERFKSITLIIFNYDRCIEHFLFHGLQKYYKIYPERSAELIRNINIYHPYGYVGNLPWAKNSDSMDFGEEPQVSKLLNLVHKIKTFTEGTDPNSSEIVAIRNDLRIASKTIFIGFAFHTLNMDLIKPTKPRPSNRQKTQCFATAYNISSSDKKVIEKQISQLYANLVNINIVDSTCYNFFTDFWRSLAF